MTESQKQDLRIKAMEIATRIAPTQSQYDAFGQQIQGITPQQLVKNAEVIYSFLINQDQTPQQ